MKNTIGSFTRHFFTIYLLVYMFPFPLDSLPVLEDAFSFSFTADVYQFVARHLLGWTALQSEFTGSGDTAYEYARLLTLFLFSSVLVGVTLLVKKLNREVLYRGVLIYARYYLGLTLISYGFAKVFNGQFSSPSLFDLEKTYGDSSPMNILWTFMGYSKPYSAFGGVCEIAAGALLLFRNTKALGGLLSLAVMLNVAMLNFSYDVPVKLYSCHLVLVSLFVIAEDALALVRFFILKQEARLPAERLPLTRSGKRYARVAVKSITIGGFTAVTIYGMVFTEPAAQLLEPKPGIFAVYKARSFSSSEDSATGQQDPLRWKKFIYEYNVIKVITEEDSAIYYEAALDTLKHELMLTSFYDSSDVSHLTYRESGSTFFLDGEWNGRKIRGSFSRKEKKDYLLLNRGFHWINEYPFNR